MVRISSHNTSPPYGVTSGSKVAQGLARQFHLLTNHSVFPKYGRITPYSWRELISQTWPPLILPS